MRVGFIGLGMMGKGMAANLQKAGHQLTVYDLHRAAAEPFLAKGAEWANSPRGVAEASEVIFTSLPVPADVEAVALGPGGLIEGMKPDTAFFDMSTNSVAVVRKINTAFAEKNLYMLDSPVSRGRTFDRLGKFLAGAYDPADFALRLLHKDVSLAVGLGKEVGVPMRLANLALEELTEALNRGWSQRDGRVGMLLQVERSKITPPAVDLQKVNAILANDN